MSVLDELRRTGTVTSHGQDSSNVHNSQFVIRRPRLATVMLYDGYAQDNLEKRMATASHFSHVRRSSSATPECKESTLSELATSFAVTPDMHSSSLGDWRRVEMLRIELTEYQVARARGHSAALHSE